MTTVIEIDDKKILSEYNAYELKMKFINFLSENLRIEKVDIFSLNVEDLNDEQLKAYKNRNNLNYIEF